MANIESQFPSPRYQLALQQEHLLVDELSDGFPEELSENEFGAARMAIRHSFRAGFISGPTDEVPELLTDLFPGSRYEEVREIINKSDCVQSIARTAFMHGVEVHG